MKNLFLLTTLLIVVLTGPVRAQEYYMGLTEEYDTLLYEEKLRVFSPVLPMLDSKLDWRDHGCITPIKNQLACGSCWAFTAIACLESHILIEGSQTPYDLSEQYVVSCDNTNWGCGGGNVHVFNWMQAHPAVLEADFPYTATNAPCTPPYPTISENFTNWYTLTPKDEVQFKAALAGGPLWTGFRVYQDFMDYWNKNATYPNDVYYHSTGSMLGLHAILLIGYDDSLEGGCWICKNSWGNTGPTGEGIFKIKYDSNCDFGLVGGSIDFDIDQTDYFVLLIDRTGSMSASRSTGPGSRFDLAIEMAHDDAEMIFLEFTDPKVAVMYFDTQGIFVELGFCDEQDLVDDAIDAVPGPAAATPLGEAMCAAADILLNSPHAGEGYLYVYTDGDENSSTTTPVSLVCDICDAHSYYPWNINCDPSNPATCTAMQLCLSDQLIANSVTYARYFGQPIGSAAPGDTRDPSGRIVTTGGEPGSDEDFKATALADYAYLQYISEESGGVFSFVCDTCTYVPPSTAVELQSFSATGFDGYVEIRWSTAAEIKNAGYNIHRGTGIDGPYVRINERLIPAAGSSLEGASYTFIDYDIPAGAPPCYYRLEDIDLHGKSTMSRPVLATEHREPGTPVAFSLSQNYPNPFNPTTEIKYDLNVGCHVKIEIFNVLGQRVRTLVDEYREAGTGTAAWDGTDAKGLPVSSGIYFCRLEAGTFVQIKKMSLLR
ncbi:MAG TPA: C1 family peptidase [Patescibacteria group bacterium]|nr:C1 family peptidase [Patescibacteria group bacterium]